jgi:dUTP pyrophosphatase
MVKVKLLNKSGYPNPEYATPESSGMDVRAILENIDVTFMFNTIENCRIDKDNKTIIKSISIAPGGRCLIPTGLFVIIPEGYEIQVRPKSGKALKRGLSITNSPGTIDSDYYYEIGVICENNSDKVIIINDGDSIAQLVLQKVPKIKWEPITEDYLNKIRDNSEKEKDSRKGGFGSTNK